MKVGLKSAGGTSNSIHPCRLTFSLFNARPTIARRFCTRRAKTVIILTNMLSVKVNIEDTQAR